MRLKRKLLSVIMTAAMITTLFAGLTITASAATTITTASQLAAMTTSGDYVLGADITIDASTWTPIGTSASPFTGTFNGGGYTVTWDGDQLTGSSYYAIFGSSSGTIKNLNVDGSFELTGSNLNYISAVVGYNSGIIANVTNSASVTASDSSYVGGIAGYNADQAGIYSCSNSGTITGYNMVGGIAGENDGVISGCSNTGAVNGTRNRNSGIGGITGRNGDTGTTKAGYVVNCYNQANVTSGDPSDPDTQGSWIGGIAGFQNNLSSCQNCYNTGNILGYKYVSYIIGKNESANADDYGVINCYRSYSSSITIANSNYSTNDLTWVDHSLVKYDNEMKGYAVDGNGDIEYESGQPVTSTSFLTDLAASLDAIWTQTTGNYPVFASHDLFFKLTSNPTTVEYTENDSFSTAGMAITAFFNNGSTDPVSLSNCSVYPSTLKSYTTGVVVSGDYTYTSNNVSKTVSFIVRIPVTVNALPDEVTLGASGCDYSDLASALDGVASGGTINVYSTTSITGAMNRNDNVTIQRASDAPSTFTGPLFTVAAGSSDVINLTTMTIKGNNIGTLFNVTSGKLRLRGNVKLKDCATAVYVDGGTLEINKASVSGNTYSVYVNDGNFILNDFGGTTISGTIYLASGTHITLGAAVPSSGLTIELPTYSEGITVADKDNNYSYFANTDPSRIHPLDPDYEVVLNNDGTELVLGVTE